MFGLKDLMDERKIREKKRKRKLILKMFVWIGKKGNLKIMFG